MNKSTKGALVSKPIQKLAPVIRLANPEDFPIDQDHVDAIRALLRRAERGESTGLAFVETTNIKGKKGYRTGATGLLDESPGFCLGTIEVLKTRLLKRIVG